MNTQAKRNSALAYEIIVGTVLALCVAGILVVLVKGFVPTARVHYSHHVTQVAP